MISDDETRQPMEEHLTPSRTASLASLAGISPKTIDLQPCDCSCKLQLNVRRFEPLIRRHNDGQRQIQMFEM